MLRWTLIPTFALLAIAGPAGAETFILPHVLEQSGDIQTTQNTFDTTLYATYVAGLPGAQNNPTNASMEIFLFDAQTEQPMVSGVGQTVCNPCLFDVSTDPRKRKISVEGLIQDAGGYGASNVVLGYAVIITGGDAPSLSMGSSITNARTGPGDLSVFVFEPQPISAASKMASSRTFVFDHLLETSGSIASPNQIDTDFYLVYSAGLPGNPAPPSGVAVDFFLYGEDGVPMDSGDGTPICAPCGFGLDAGNRHQVISVQSLADAAGGFASAPEGGFVVVWAHGDAGNLSIQDVTSNSNAGPDNLTQWGGGLNEVPSSAPTPVGPDGRLTPAMIEWVRGYPNPFNPRTTVEFRLATAADLEVRIVDARGRRVRDLFSGSLGSGPHQLQWDGRDDAGVELASGVYYARVAVADEIQVRKLTLVR